MKDPERLRLFPLPTSVGGEHRDGALFHWPETCQACQERPCENGPITNRIETCPYGINFVRHDRDLLIGGIVVRDLSLSTPAHRKRAKTMRSSLVSAEDIRRSISALSSVDASQDKLAEELRERDKAQYLSAEESRREIVDELRPAIEQGLHQAHDYLLLLQQIQQNAATVLEERFPGVRPEEAADRLPNEGAIYFAAAMMLAKIDATVYLREPNRIHSNPEQFAIFKLVDKYARIYRSFARQREVRLELAGECFAVVSYPSNPVGAVIHTLLDNMVKYAPPKSAAVVRFVEEANSVRIAYSSLGPQVRSDERQRIFLPGYQADAARLVAGGGMGFGLAAAKLISDALHLDLRFKQATKEAYDSPGYYQTEFSIRLDKTGSESTVRGARRSPRRRSRR